MHPGDLSRLHNLLRIDLTEARDILTYGAIKQFYILWQISDAGPSASLSQVNISA